MARSVFGAGAANGLAVITALVLPAGAAALDSGQRPSPPPTMEQLLEQPPATDIVSRFVAACVDHAGNPRAQEAAGQRLGITWPYQLFVRRTEQGNECAIASTVAQGETTETLGRTVETALSARGLSPVRIGDGSFTSMLTLGGRSFTVDGNIERMQQSPMLVAVVLLTDRGPARR